MTPATKGQKIVGGVLLGIILMWIVGAVVMGQLDDQALRTADAGASAAEMTHQLDNDIKDTQLRYIELTQGELAASSMKLCYSRGYPVHENLSNRKYDECNKIAQKSAKIAAKDEAREHAADKAYDRKHKR